MQCPICETASAIFDKKMHLYRCRECLHTFTKLPAEMQEKYEGEYFEEDHKNWFENPNYKLFMTIEQHISKIKTVNLLDVGCGRGDFLLWLQGRHPDWRLTGIDLAPNKHDTIRFITGDIFAIPLAEKFNVITCFALVEHLEEIKPFIQKMAGLLEPDGIFVVNTFNADSMIFSLARMLKSIGIRVAFDRLYSHHHLQHYSKKSIRKILTLWGFDILEHRCHNYPLKAVDVPKAGKLVERIYKSVVGSVFLISDPIGMGIEHTIICKPKTAQ
jgi:2-polyprenyl-3-methyl-5-hydroxy-6-metoxy-1,4-benzoquinol methylase